MLLSPCDALRLNKRLTADHDRLVVCMDANENICKKYIGQPLTSVEGLNMQAVVGEFTGKKIGPTFFKGSKPIDRVWATNDLIVTHACVMPAGFDVGDHHIIITISRSQVWWEQLLLGSSGSPPEGSTLNFQVDQPISILRCWWQTLLSIA